MTSVWGEGVEEGGRAQRGLIRQIQMQTGKHVLKSHVDQQHEDRSVIPVSSLADVSGQSDEGGMSTWDLLDLQSNA